MNQLRRVLAFGLPFLWPYRKRFFSMVVLSLLFGLTNGAFVLATKILFERLTPSAAQSSPDIPISPGRREPIGLGEFSESWLSAIRINSPKRAGRKSRNHHPLFTHLETYEGIFIASNLQVSVLERAEIRAGFGKQVPHPRIPRGRRSTDP